MLVEIVRDPYALDPDPIVSVSVPVLEFNEMLDPPEIASDLTPVLAILILLLPLETLIPLPAVIVDSANPLDEPINNCPLDIEEVFRPVPPYALLIILPCHVPELIVPTVCRLDAEVRLLSVSIAVSIAVSYTHLTLPTTPYV